uniref:MFS domain-containing protein n=1 Tax=Panagrellus redivivus TaxID=6233 RepID=A0A7E4VYZ2_PANRE
MRGRKAVLPRCASLSANMDAEADTYIAYPKRWFILAVVVLLNFSNAMTWITYAPISYFTKEYFGNTNAPTFYNSVFMVLSIPCGFAAMWSIDKHGLRTGCLIGVVCNLIGNVLRVLGALSFLSKPARFYTVLCGQCIAACAQPFIMFLTTKLAAFWFPDHQRALANTLGSMANPLGIAVMYATASLFVNNSHPDAFVLLNGIVAIPAVIAAALAFGVTSSVPPTPASASTNLVDIETPNFVEGLRRCIKSKSFLMLSVGIGGGLGLFNALYNNLQPALCVKGYSDSFSGGIGALLIVSGLIGAAVSGVYVDKTKKFEETMKCCFCVAGIAACSLTIALQYVNVHWWIALSIFVFGAFGFAIYPIGLELGVEVSFPVAEASSSGLLIIAGQLQGVLYIIITGFLTRDATPREMEVQTCMKTSDPKDVPDWQYAFIAWNVIVVGLIVIFVACFWPQYRRTQYEQATRTITTERPDTPPPQHEQEV